MKKDINLATNSKLLATKLIQLIKEDDRIVSSENLSLSAIKNSLPAVCNAIITAIADNNLSLLNIDELNRGRLHGLTRSRQDFQPEEMAREFFLLKRVVLGELKPQLVDCSAQEVIEQLELIDLVIERVMENSFQSYAEVREQQINSLNQQIFLTNQEITRLIVDHQERLSYLIHELKNPLTSIIGYSNLFLRSQQQSDRTADLEHIQQVLKQGRNLLRIINDTLEIDSYQQGNLKLRSQPVDVCTLLADITISLKPAIEAKKLELITSCIPEKLVIQSDALRLQQIITNLLTNAIRYTHKGKITLTCEQTKKQQLQIKVMDTGVGIAESDHERVFEQYFRSQKSRQNVPEGIGLGLSIVAQLVTILEGEIELISEIDVGSTFIVTIPLNS